MSIRTMSFTTPSVVAAFLGMSLAPHAATAAFTVFGNGLAQVCADAARTMERGLTPPPQSVETCTMAIENEDLRQRDRAGTYINRGTLYLARGGYREAKQDFDSAIEIMPALGEAYTNRGAALVGLQLYNDAIADIDRGLALNPGEPEKAYFNRGLAEEALDNIPAAYRDYSRAAELKPGWAPPRNELSRFTVGTRRS
jgi:tetratricopeptide (TPR) repeat protein